jgi:hypothetical protein
VQTPCRNSNIGGANFAIGTSRAESLYVWLSSLSKYSILAHNVSALASLFPENEDFPKCHKRHANARLIYDRKVEEVHYEYV